MKFLNKFLLALVLTGSFVGANANRFTDLKEKYNNFTDKINYELQCGEFVKKHGLDKKILGDWNIAQVLYIGAHIPVAIVVGTMLRAQLKHALTNRYSGLFGC